MYKSKQENIYTYYTQNYNNVHLSYKIFNNCFCYTKPKQLYYIDIRFKTYFFYTTLKGLNHKKIK